MISQEIQNNVNKGKCLNTGPSEGMKKHARIYYNSMRVCWVSSGNQFYLELNQIYVILKNEYVIANGKCTAKISKNNNNLVL